MFTAFTLLLKISMHVQVIYFLIFLIFWKAFWTEIFFIDFGSPKKSKKKCLKSYSWFSVCVCFQSCRKCVLGYQGTFRGTFFSSLSSYFFLSCIVYKCFILYFLICLIFWKAFWTEICFIDFGSPKKWKKNDWKVIHCFLFAFVYKVAENVFWAIRALFVVPSSLLFHLTCFLSCIVYKFLSLYFLIFFFDFQSQKK